MNGTTGKEVETMRRITKIEVNKRLTPKKLRVAAYARVSTDSREQLISLEVQKSHYEAYIKGNPEWEYVGLYYDEGLSGTSMAKRDVLQKMISDCEKGLIDLIIIKSISRFARNTTECLEVVRKLIKLKVAIFFEKENINTGNMEGELLLTIFSSLAENESVSISKNESWAIKRRFQKGTFKISYPPYGYKNEDGKMVIDEEEAEVVRFIFAECLSGKGGFKIAEALSEKNVPTKRGGNWSGTTVNGILKNEKYTGDALLQKTFTDSNFKKRFNKGEKTQYYVKDHHEAIISKEDFEAVQVIISQRAKEKNSVAEEEKYLNRYPFSGKIICSECGATWKRRTHTSCKTKYYAYICKTHLKDKSKCSQLYIRETDFEEAFVNMINKLIFSKKVLLKPFLNSLKCIDQNDVLVQIDELETALEENFDRRQVIANLLSKQYIEPALYAKENSELLAEAEELRKEKDSMYRAINGEQENAEAVERLLKYVTYCENLKEFDADAFEAHVDHIVVYSRSEIGFVLKCGLTFKERL
jgi:DNA invertase Pin-like site-specific DNA recombinase